MIIPCCKGRETETLGHRMRLMRPGLVSAIVFVGQSPDVVQTLDSGLELLRKLSSSLSWGCSLDLSSSEALWILVDLPITVNTVVEVADVYVLFWCRFEGNARGQGISESIAR